MNGCKGAWLHSYTDWFIRNGGVSPHEGSYVYLDKYPNLNCNKARYVKKWKSGAKVIRSLQEWRCNEAKLKKMVYENGAVDEIKNGKDCKINLDTSELSDHLQVSWEGSALELIVHMLLMFYGDRENTGKVSPILDSQLSEIGTSF